jgi:hypothetical protein
MSKDVVLKAANDVVVPDGMKELMDMMPKAEAKDLSIPTILTVQTTSEFVEGDVKAGDIINRDTLQVLGGVGKKLNFIPLTFFKSWQHFSRLEGKQTWLNEEMYTGQSYPWTEEGAGPGGADLIHDETYSFYVLLESELTNAMATPYLLKLKRTSAGEAKKLVTAMDRAKNAFIEPWSLIFSIETSKEKGEKGVYFVTVVNPVVDGTSTKRLKDGPLNLSRDWAALIIKQQATLNAKKMAEPDAPIASPQVERVAKKVEQTLPY